MTHSNPYIQGTFVPCTIKPTRATCMYRIAGNIGRKLYLADWQISCHTANVKSANIVPTA